MHRFLNPREILQYRLMTTFHNMNPASSSNQCTEILRALYWTDHILVPCYEDYRTCDVLIRRVFVATVYDSFTCLRIGFWIRRAHIEPYGFSSYWIYLSVLAADSLLARSRHSSGLIMCVPIVVEIRPGRNIRCILDAFLPHRGRKIEHALSYSGDVTSRLTGTE